MLETTHSLNLNHLVSKRDQVNAIKQHIQKRQNKLQADITSQIAHEALQQTAAPIMSHSNLTQKLAIIKQRFSNKQGKQCKAEHIAN